MLKVLSRIKAEPWAITPKYMETILEIAQRDNLSPESVAQTLGRPLENTRDVEFRDGVAIIPVDGPLFRYANMFSAISGATSYQNLATDFYSALNNPDVESILLYIDSPGGEANGVSEFAEQVFQARGQKKIVAYVGGTGASAAYWIASAADEIVIDETASVGSIGTVLGVTDTSERDEKNGIKRMEFVSYQSPYKRVDPTTDEGRAKLQSWVDQLGDVFVDKMARNRSYSRDTVLSDFGQGDILIGKAAVSSGMADRLGSFEGTVQYLIESQGRRPGSSGTFRGARKFNAETGVYEGPSGASDGNNHDEWGNGSMNLEQFKAEHPDLYNQAFAEGEQAAQSKIDDAKTAAAETERERIKSIQDMAMKGHEDIANQAMFEKPISAEQFAVEVVKAEKGRKAQFLNNRNKDASDLEEVEGDSSVPDPSAQSQENRADEEERARLRKAAANAVKPRRSMFSRKEG